MPSQKNCLFYFLGIILSLFIHIECHESFNRELDEEIRSLIAADELQEKTYRNTPLDKKKFICVSLGFNCIPALNLNKNDLRQEAFPFDWNLTSLSGLSAIIENNFVDFLNPNYFDRRAGIYNKKYNFSFAHDFPVVRQADGTDTEVTNYLDYLEDITEKYERRIKRFYNVCSMADTVYFFRLRSTWRLDRTAQPRERVIQLKDLLLKTFPSKNWVLVVIDTIPDYRGDWNIPMVKNFYISDHGHLGEWTTIFKKLGLL